MPSNSTSIFQEGAEFKSFQLVKDNVFNEKELIEQLQLPGQYPNCSGTRALNDNLSDIKAQIAANLKGANLVNELIDSYGLSVVQAYMNHIQQNAELEVRDLLKRVATEKNTCVLSAEDMMDDGTVIALTIQIDPTTGNATFDFSGTGEMTYGNCNAPKVGSPLSNSIANGGCAFFPFHLVGHILCHNILPSLYDWTRHSIESRLFGSYTGHLSSKLNHFPL